ncbi:MAG: metallophosphoesterase [Muribaculum sp.]|nr:metallophosphoesterase [Muribaculum sp.]
MRYTILHISDIHKSPEMKYDSLLQSLERDMCHYTENEEILKPSFIVVSGDIIQGALTDTGIRNQYAEVEVFLDGLCNLFLEGDRQKLIMVPGNHDVNRSKSLSSMNPSTDTKKKARDKYFSGSPSVRWSWKDFKFYNIIDQNLYNSRFDLFIEFYNRFYNGIRQFPKDPVKEAFLVKNDEYKVTFACFNSCHQLDHLCFTGCIPEEAIVSVGGSLIDSYNSGYLNIAVWHHHFYGAPLTTNYIDRNFLTYLLEYNVQVGLFGHQHYSQIAEEFSDLQLYKDDQIQRLLLVSSGTLFGCDKELGAGKRRQYNLIEIEQTNGVAKVSVNIREDRNPHANSLCPIWHCHALSNPSNKIIRNIELRKLSEEMQLLEIDRKVRSDGDYISACERLLELKLDNIRKKSLWLEYLSRVQNFEYVYNSLSIVDSIEKAILKITAAIKLDDPSKKQKITEDPFINASTDSNVIDLLKML